MEKCEKVRQSLKIIEMLDGNLPDDTYLEKTIDGLSKILQNDVAIAEEFLQKSGIGDFITKHFANENLQFFAFRLARISCHVQKSLIMKHLDTLKKWPLSSEFMELLNTLLSMNQTTEEFLKLIWVNLLARVIQSQNLNSKSLFWKKSAEKLLTTFLQCLDGMMELFDRVCTVFIERSADPLISRVLTNYYKIWKNPLVSLVDIVPEKHLNLEALLYKNLRSQNAENCFLYHFDQDPEKVKVWIKVAKNMSTIGTNKKLLDLAREDYRSS